MNGWVSEEEQWRWGPILAVQRTTSVIVDREECLLYFEHWILALIAHTPLCILLSYSHYKRYWEKEQTPPSLSLLLNLLVELGLVFSPHPPAAQLQLHIFRFSWTKESQDRLVAYYGLYSLNFAIPTTITIAPGAACLEPHWLKPTRCLEIEMLAHAATKEPPWCEFLMAAGRGEREGGKGPIK